jgi:Domain of unknown function (DUF4124)
MRVVLHCAILVGSIAAAGPLHADTYKWVDANGVTNYSDEAPPAHSAGVQVIQDRVSVVPSDPSLAAAIAEFRSQAARQQEFDEAEWLQRQRMMLAAQMVSAPAPCESGADCGIAYPLYTGAYYPYYAPAVVTGVGYRHSHGRKHRPSHWVRGGRSMNGWR